MKRKTTYNLTKVNRPFKRPRTTQAMTLFARPVMGLQARPPGVLRSNKPELKALDNPNGVLALNSTGAILLVNAVRTGSTFCNRIGRKMEMKSIRLVGFISPIRAQTLYDYVRILIVYDRQTNGALPAIGDILQSTDQAAANGTSAFSGINLNNRDRFVIIRDGRFSLPEVTGAVAPFLPGTFIDQVTPTQQIDWFCKIPQYLTQYKADSAPAVIGDIATGSLLVVTLGVQAAAAEGYQLNLETRLRFNDL